MHTSPALCKVLSISTDQAVIGEELTDIRLQVMEGLFDVKFAEAENVRQVYELDKVIQGIKPHEGLDGTEQCQLWLLEHRDWIIKARSSATKSSTREPTERRNAIKNAREWLKTWNALNGKANDQPGSGKECDTPVLQRMIALLAVRLERPDGDGKLAHR
jgi:hypothetical protein